MIRARKKQLWPLAAALLLMATAGGAAREVDVYLEDGRRISGQLVEDSAEKVTIEIAGIETSFPRRQVHDVRARPSLTERFEQRRNDLDDEDWHGRFDLVRWLVDQQQPEADALALEELDALLEQRTPPEHAERLHAALSERVEAHRERQALLEQGVAGQGVGEGEAEPLDADDVTETIEPLVGALEAGRLPGREPSPVLSDAQIATLKAFETDLNERPTVFVPRDVVEDLFERYREDPLMEPFLGRNGMARFTRLAGHEQLGILFQLRAREYYDRVTIRTEPRTLQEFRSRIHPTYVARYCGQCHGSSAEMETPSLTLISQHRNGEALAYTNFLILRRTQVNGVPLINPDDPSRSPLIQYGLPPDDAVTPHPPVRGWRPHFTGRQDRRIQPLLRWMSDLYDGGDYPIDYDLPAKASGDESADAAGDDP